MRARQRQRRELLRTRAGYACEYCRIPETLMGGRLTEDHIIPLNASGIDDVDNLCWCCWWCNVYKGSQAAAPTRAQGMWYRCFIRVRTYGRRTFAGVEAGYGFSDGRRPDAPPWRHYA
jgi:hypothetical protein